MPFGSNAPGAKEMLKTMVPPRLENNFKLKKSLQVGAHNVWVKPSDSDIIQRSMTLPIEGEKLIELLRMIIRGLSFYHWKVVIPKNYRVDVYALPLEGLIHFRDKIEPNFFHLNNDIIPLFLFKKVPLFKLFSCLGKTKKNSHSYKYYRHKNYIRGHKNRHIEKKHDGLHIYIGNGQINC